MKLLSVTLQVLTSTRYQISTLWLAIHVYSNTLYYVEMFCCWNSQSIASPWLDSDLSLLTNPYCDKILKKILRRIFSCLLIQFWFFKIYHKYNLKISTVRDFFYIVVFATRRDHHLSMQGSITPLTFSLTFSLVPWGTGLWRSLELKHRAQVDSCINAEQDGTKGSCSSDGSPNIWTY